MNCQFIEDVKRLVDYCTESHDILDYLEQLRTKDLEPEDMEAFEALVKPYMEGVDDYDLYDAMYEAANKDPYEFARIVGTGHVYPSAVRVLMALNGPVDGEDDKFQCELCSAVEDIDDSIRRGKALICVTCNDKVEEMNNDTF